MGFSSIFLLVGLALLLGSKLRESGKSCSHHQMGGCSEPLTTALGALTRTDCCSALTRPGNGQTRIGQVSYNNGVMWLGELALSGSSTATSPPLQSLFVLDLVETTVQQ